MTTLATPADAGCWIDGTWGRFVSVRVVGIALHYGWELSPEDLATYDRLFNETQWDGPLALDDDWDALLDQGGMADDAEKWLNEHIAPDGYAFGWHAGEFFLWPDETWEQEC